jgi:hypothetical protein
VKDLCEGLMQTIERLCKYKDVTDLVYKSVHQLLTKELISELNRLQAYYYYQDCKYVGRCGLNFTLLYNEKEPSLLNWRYVGRNQSYLIHNVNHRHFP